MTHLVVSNSAFTHTCLQVVVYSMLPPPRPTAPGKNGDDGPWQPSQEVLQVQGAVLMALDKVGGGEAGGGWWP